MKTLAIELQRETNFKIFFSANLITGKIVANWTWTADDFSIKSRQRPPHSKQKIDGECMRASACQCSCARRWFFIWYDTNTEADDGRHHRQSQYSNIFFYKIIHRRLSRTASHSLARCAHNFLFSHLRCLTEMKTERRKKIVVCIIYYFASARHSNQIYVLLCSRGCHSPSHTHTENSNNNNKTLFIYLRCVRQRWAMLFVNQLYLNMCNEIVCPHLSNMCARRSFIYTSMYSRYCWVCLAYTHRDCNSQSAQKSNRIATVFFISSLSFIYFFFVERN